MQSIQSKESDFATYQAAFIGQLNIKDLIAHARELESLSLSERQRCDLELLMNGGFAPLTGYLNEWDYDSVIARMRLTSGDLWPIPITLDVDEEFADGVGVGDEIALRDPEGNPLAMLKIGSCWKPDLMCEAAAVFGRFDPDHPGVRRLLAETRSVYLGGEITVIKLPDHPGMRAYCKSPAQLRELFAASGLKSVIAFQTRNPMHRGHVELALRAARESHAALLLHPAIGPSLPGDIDLHTRMRCYEHIVKRMPADMNVMLAALPLAMRLAGPREALWHALIRRNYGCSHFIVGRDHAGTGKDARGTDYYPPLAAQQMVSDYQSEIGIKVVSVSEMLYLEDENRYVKEEEIGLNQQVTKLSGTELRRRIAKGIDVPSWMADADVVQELRRALPVNAQRGFTVFFTGLSGSGKSTIANALLAVLLEQGERPVTLLDGDVVRQNLSSELSFSRAHRDLNVTRIGYVASEITKHRGIAICAPIAPYARTRQRVREMVSQHGGFFEVYVATPLAVCEARDPKGLYAKARAGLIPEFTGISDPYEAPTDPEIAIDTRFCSVDQAVAQIIVHLLDREYWSSSNPRLRYLG